MFLKNVYFYLYEHKSNLVDIIWKIYKNTYLKNYIILLHQKKKKESYQCINILGDTNINIFILCVYIFENLNYGYITNVIFHPVYIYFLSKYFYSHKFYPMAVKHFPVSKAT